MKSRKRKSLTRESSSQVDIVTLIKSSIRMFHSMVKRQIWILKVSDSNNMELLLNRCQIHNTELSPLIMEPPTMVNNNSNSPIHPKTTNTHNKPTNTPQWNSSSNSTSSNSTWQPNNNNKTPIWTLKWTLIIPCHLLLSNNSRWIRWCWIIRNSWMSKIKMYEI